GSPESLLSSKRSLTGAYLAGRESIPYQPKQRPPAGEIKVIGAKEHNLKNLEVRFPIGRLSVVTGVSGAGKSTLVNSILYPAIARKLHDSSRHVGKHTSIEGLELIDKVIDIDQHPIG